VTITREIINSVVVRLAQQFRLIAGVDKNLNPQLLRVSTSGSLLTAGGFDIPDHDYVSITYHDAGKTNINQVIYKTGGAAGTTVATVTLSYAGQDPAATPSAKVTSVALT
jgi:hypothetical protein